MFHASRAVYTHYPVVENDRLFLPAEVLMKAAQGDWPYLIITDNYEWDEAGTKGGYIDDLAEEFEELARWKTMKGLRARVNHCFRYHGQSFRQSLANRCYPGRAGSDPQFF